jgi:superfamily II DNA or RNA helicase
MSQAAMTSGLEWTVKVTAQDMAHILQRFSAEFETYWSSPEFEVYDRSQANRLADAIQHAKTGQASSERRFFAELHPYAFQERILEALEAARIAGKNRNLVVAATGTGKTVIAAFDYVKFTQGRTQRPTLLFVAHRKEILEQARDCFRTILRDQNFGELLVGGARPTVWMHVFASVQSLQTAGVFEKLSPSHFQFIVLDEAHHVVASTYRPIFEYSSPEVLLGLTATPERMDGSSILPDFGGEFTAEIRLPEALEAKLLCPFHYFGIADPVSLADERFWKNGQYDTAAIAEAYTGDDLRAQQRLDVIFASLTRYQPDLSRTRAVGFCASVSHAHYMAAAFKQQGYTAEVVLGETPSDVREFRVLEFRAGRIGFLFTVDVFSEGVDVPEINLVLFLRPTESLTVFLQQLGRGLRHHTDKECLTVLDLVGQSHHRYRIDRKFAALLTRHRIRIDYEVERDFPNLPPGCNIQLERVAREHILNNIRESLRNLATYVTESLQTFEQEHKMPATFSNFVKVSKISPLELLKTKTWSEWKAVAAHTPMPRDPDIAACRQTLRRLVLRTDSRHLDQLATLLQTVAEDQGVYGMSDSDGAILHYLLWGKKAGDVGVESLNDSFKKWLSNRASVNDLLEVIAWRKSQNEFPIQPIKLSYPCTLQLHAAYGSAEIKAAFQLATLHKSGPTGVGVFHVEDVKTYIHLVTFRKSEKDFSPTTQYRDYPISRTQLHWESQSGTSQSSATGQNYLYFVERGYTILFFARLEKSVVGETSPFIFLGPAKSIISAEGNRPVAIVWELAHAIPAVLFEEAKTA